MQVGWLVVQLVLVAALLCLAALLLLRPPPPRPHARPATVDYHEAYGFREMGVTVGQRFAVRCYV